MVIYHNMVLFKGEIDRKRGGALAGKLSVIVGPHVKVLEDLFNHIRVLNESNDPHSTGTLCADKRIHLVDFLYQPCPVFSESLVG